MKRKKETTDAAFTEECPTLARGLQFTASVTQSPAATAQSRSAS